MVKVLFVCLGNICRSPMAEFIFKDMVEKEGLDDKFLIESRGTSNEEEGNPVYPPAREELKKHGIHCDGKLSRPLKKADYDDFDYLLAMDNMNLKNIERITGKKGGKIQKLLVYAGEKGEIADPWYYGGFDRTFEEIKRGLSAFLSYLKERGEV